MATRYKTITIGASGTGETLKDALAGLGEKRRKVKGLQFTTDSTITPPFPDRSKRVRAYKNQDQICDYQLGHFDVAVFSNTCCMTNISMIDLDVELAKGDGFQVGLYDAAAAPSGNLIMVYEDLE